MVSKAGGVFIGIFVVLILAAVAWVVFTQMRARRLGLPPPPFSSYIPFLKRDETPYGPPRPAPGGVVGFINDRIRNFKNRNNRTAAGAYEGSSERRGLGPLDPDEAWDSRVGHDGDAYYEEQELGYRGGGASSASGGSAYQGGGGGGGDAYNMNLAATPAHPPEGLGGRGRSPGGDGLKPQTNPFDDDAEVEGSLRGVSPRPIETGLGSSKQGKDDDSPTERRSMFRENM